MLTSEQINQASSVLHIACTRQMHAHASLGPSSHHDTHAQSYVQLEGMHPCLQQINTHRKLLPHPTYSECTTLVHNLDGQHHTPTHTHTQTHTHTTFPHRLHHISHTVDVPLMSSASHALVHPSVSLHIITPPSLTHGMQQMSCVDVATAGCRTLHVILTSDHTYARG